MLSVEIENDSCGGVKGSQKFEMKCVETRHSCEKLIVLDNQITIEVVTK